MAKLLGAANLGSEAPIGLRDVNLSVKLMEDLDAVLAELTLEQRAKLREALLVMEAGETVNHIERRTLIDIFFLCMIYIIVLLL